MNFSRYHHVPLFLEWAPEGVFKSDLKKKKKDVDDTATATASPSTTTETGDIAEEDADAPRATLFVKNLNFTSSEESLHQVFASCAGYRLVSIMKKKSVSGASNENLSMGYGFVEFDTL